MLSGSEMVRPETVEAFVEHFAPAGVDPTRFRASYGLAEATLGVSIESTGRGVHTRTVADVDTVALGSPMTDIELYSPQSGAPELALSGRAAAAGRDAGLNCWSVSLSHDSGLAIAFVIGLGA